MTKNNAKQEKKQTQILLQHDSYIFEKMKIIKS